ncbi:MAG: N-acetylmuramoyl-L-alanine amidase [Oscillospiraceae bacterium]|nr:N-acetylmuramoyl-L-alanine amidase [Oscillospiraceae bacterium]
MPIIFLSPSTQESNPYLGGGTEEEYMNILADRMEPYLRSSGIRYVRNDPDRQAIGAINDSNAGTYDAHIALHTNAAPENLAGKLRGIDVYYAPNSQSSQRLANTMANNFESIYPLPDKVRALPTDFLGEVLRTKAPAILAEIGYHDNLEDVTWLKNNLTKIAANIVQSIADYFGIPFVEAGPVQSAVVVTDYNSGLNIRDFPSTSSAIIGYIPNGSTVEVYGQADDWYVVGYNGVIGYAYSPFIVI